MTEATTPKDLDHQHWLGLAPIKRDSADLEGFALTVVESRLSLIPTMDWSDQEGVSSNAHLLCCDLFYTQEAEGIRSELYR
jgi:hypothetical protein